MNFGTYETNVKLSLNPNIDVLTFRVLSARKFSGISVLLERRVPIKEISSSVKALANFMLLKKLSAVTHRRFVLKNGSQSFKTTFKPTSCNQKNKRQV